MSIGSTVRMSSSCDASSIHSIMGFFYLFIYFYYFVVLVVVVFVATIACEDS